MTSVRWRLIVSDPWSVSGDALDVEVSLLKRPLPDPMIAKVVSDYKVEGEGIDRILMTRRHATFELDHVLDGRQVSVNGAFFRTGESDAFKRFLASATLIADQPENVRESHD